MIMNWRVNYDSGHRDANNCDTCVIVGFVNDGLAFIVAMSVVFKI